MSWTVKLASKAIKQYGKLPQAVQARVDALLLEIETSGPVRSNWKNYGLLRGHKGTSGGECHHCHVKKGKPSYVVCWEVVKNEIRVVEVYYAGTHEKAPY